MKSIHDIVEESGCSSIMDLLELVSLTYASKSPEELYYNSCIMSLFISMDKDLASKFIEFKREADEAYSVIYNGNYN